MMQTSILAWQAAIVQARGLNREVHFAYSSPISLYTAVRASI